MSSGHCPAFLFAQLGVRPALFAERAEMYVVVITQLEKERRLACQGRAKGVVKRCEAPLTGGVLAAQNMGQGEQESSPQCPGKPLRFGLGAGVAVLRFGLVDELRPAAVLRGVGKSGCDWCWLCTLLMQY